MTTTDKRITREEVDLLFPLLTTSAWQWPETLPTEALDYDDVDHLIADVKRSGSHFFDDDTMRWFKSRIDDELAGRRFFVTSEKPPHGPREYSVRWVHIYSDHPENRHIERLDARFVSLRAARSMAQRMARVLGFTS